MTLFREHGFVQIVCLEKAHRPIDGTPSIMRQPPIGDNGTIVHISINKTGKAIYIGESIDNEGKTL